LKSYKELEVWGKAVKLTTETYRATETLPRAEQFGLTAQARRAAASVPANIAEGWGRGFTKEYIQFLLIARASLMELETHIIVATQLNYLSTERLGPLQTEIENIGKMLNRLIQALRAR
jgi:four helix bundle protein